MQKGRCSEHIEGAELLHKGTASCESHGKFHVTDATVGSWHNRKQQSPICVDFPSSFSLWSLWCCTEIALSYYLPPLFSDELKIIGAWPPLQSPQPPSISKKGNFLIPKKLFLCCLSGPRETHSSAAPMLMQGLAKNDTIDNTAIPFWKSIKAKEFGVAVSMLSGWCDTEGKHWKKKSERRKWSGKSKQRSLSIANFTLTKRYRFPIKIETTLLQHGQVRATAILV